MHVFFLKYKKQIKYEQIDVQHFIEKIGFIEEKMEKKTFYRDFHGFSGP